MISNRASFTLASAKIEISDFISKSLAITDDEINFLENIRKRIDIVHNAYRDLIYNALYRQKNQSIPFQPSITQESIMNDAARQQTDMLGFTWATVKELLASTTAAKNNSTHKSYKKLLNFVEECFTGVLDNIKLNIVNNPIQTSNKNDKDTFTARLINYTNGYIGFYNEKYFYANDNAHVKLINSMGGRYIPFGQHLDPLRGKELVRGVTAESEGLCAGYTKAWCDEIKKYGHAVKLPRLDDYVYYRQFQHTFNDKFFSDWKKDFSSQTDFRILIDDMLNCMQPEKIYELVWDSDTGKPTTPKHATGIRLIPGQDSVEFFDPNFGIVVFDHRMQFTSWLAHYLCLDNFNMLVDDNSVGGTLSLHALKNQPANAIPSIPPLQSKSENTEPEKNLRHTLAATAAINNIKLSDRGFLRRHWFDILHSAPVFLLTTSILNIIFPPASFASALITMGVGFVTGIVYETYMAFNQSTFTSKKSPPEQPSFTLTKINNSTTVNIMQKINSRQYSQHPAPGNINEKPIHSAPAIINESPINRKESLRPSF